MHGLVVIRLYMISHYLEVLESRQRCGYVKIPALIRGQPIIHRPPQPSGYASVLEYLERAVAVRYIKKAVACRHGHHGFTFIFGQVPSFQECSIRGKLPDEIELMI